MGAPERKVSPSQVHRRRMPGEAIIAAASARRGACPLHWSWRRSPMRTGHGGGPDQRPVCAQASVGYKGPQRSAAWVHCARVTA
eukprot:scaffold212_cov404-Prasinococcus_capsulatus_cf.AAC.20